MTTTTTLTGGRTRRRRRRAGRTPPGWPPGRRTGHRMLGRPVAFVFSVAAAKEALETSPRSRRSLPTVASLWKAVSSNRANAAHLVSFFFSFCSSFLLAVFEPTARRPDGPFCKSRKPSHFYQGKMKSKRLRGAEALVVAVTLLSVALACNALSASSPRRSFIRKSGVTIATIATCGPASAAPLPLQTASSGTSPTTVRVEEVGGGFDLLSPPSSAIKSSDIFYPASMAGTSWKVQRAITSVEGDANQAAVAWKSLGVTSGPLRRN